MVQIDEQLDVLIGENYVPSSVETKKTVLMYFFVGIVIVLIKEKVTNYELFHLKQALGWWVIFFIAMMFGVVLVFIPRFWILPVLFFLGFIVIRILFVKQAYEGRYVIDEDKILLPLFAGLGGWILSVFDLETVSGNNVPNGNADDRFRDKETGFDLHDE